MIDKRVWRRIPHGVRNVILSLFIVPSVLFGAASAGASAAKPAADDSFVITIQGDLISLKAKEAPVLAIIKEIGRKMDIEIAGEIPDAEKVSLEFQKLTFDEAMGRLGVDYAYVTGKGNRIIKVTLLPKGDGESVPMAAAQSASVRVVGDIPTPAVEAPSAVLPQKSASDKVEEKRTLSPEPFKFEFNP